MNRQRGISLAVVTAIVVLATPLLADAVISAGSVNVSPGHTFTVPVSIADVSDLFAFQFDLAFDPAILQLQTISEGGFLPSAGSTIFSPGTIDNTAGTATTTADTLTGTGPGASGSGVLADFTFQAIGLGTTALTLSNVILLDSSLTDIPSTSVNGSVHVAVPEPSGLSWIGALALGAALRLRKAV